MLTVTVVLPVTLPLVAVTEPVADVSDAVNRPLVLMVPTPPVCDQVNVGSVTKAALNWSVAVAENCCATPAFSAGDAGLTVIVATVCATVTLTLLVAVSPPGSVIVAVKT